MTIDKHKVVTLHYKLYENDEKGTLIEETFDKEPMVFLFGADRMIPAFETNLEGKKPGDSFSFSIAQEDAYGAYDSDAVVSVPIETFVVNGRLAKDLLEVGRRIPMADEEGNPMDGTVKEVKKKEVVLDFNHPLAGINLYFSGRIEELRAATDSEVAHGHVHEPGGEDH